MSKKFQRKKMIEVSIPLDAINKASAREKSIRHGHPSTLHLWWARRPLAACRAVLFCSMVDDPEHDPMFVGNKDGAIEKRKELFHLIEELVVWKNSNNPRVINSARAEIARCVCSHKIEDKELSENDEIDEISTAKDILNLKAPAGSVNKFLIKYAPPVLDPFAGGGSIPLEAQRLGLRVFASDLNPIPVLINKAQVEIPPKFSGKAPVNPDAAGKTAGFERAGVRGLADDVRYYGAWMRKEAEKRIGHLYPKIKITQEMADDGRPDLVDLVGQELTAIAWIWGRTVASPNPAAKGARVPLVRSYWLSKKKNREVCLAPVVDKVKLSYSFKVLTGKAVPKDKARRATVERTGATCLLTETPISFDYIASEGQENRIGNMLLACICESPNGRVYLPASYDQEKTAFEAEPKDYPETSLPEQALGFRVQRYGIDKHYKLFTSRQLVALTTFSEMVGKARNQILADDPEQNDEYANAVALYLGFGVSRQANYSTTLNAWGGDFIVQTFGRQALPMVWDFAEGNPFSSSTGNWTGAIEWIAKCIEFSLPAIGCAQVTQSDAVSTTRTENVVLSTDPPYYDNIGYADLSDFFYVWLKRSLGEIYQGDFSTLLTPKAAELISTPHRHDGDKKKSEKWFEIEMGKAFSNLAKQTVDYIPTTIFYAFKQSEKDSSGDTVSTGWETFLEGVLSAGFSINATWPLRTERDKGLKSGSNVLATSILLCCGPKSLDAVMSTRKEFVMSLRSELQKEIRHYRDASISPVDLAQASIGPGMSIYSKFSKIVESDGSAMTIRTALGLINRVLDDVLNEQDNEYDSDTRWAITWFSQFKNDNGPYGDAESLSRAKNVSVKGLEESGIMTSAGGKARLLTKEELREDWTPETDDRLTVWETTHYLIRYLQEGGITKASELAYKLGSNASNARDLAYRLYDICEKNNWSKEARDYNYLVTEWPNIIEHGANLEHAANPKEKSTQAQLF